MEKIDYSIKTLDSINLYAQAWLPESNRKGLVLIIHGLGEHSGRYTHVAKVLTDAGYIASALDLRGHGKSDGKRGHAPSLDAVIEDINIFIAENESRFAGFPLFLYGHSLGSLFLLKLVVEKKPKINGLMITGPALRNELESQRLKIALINILGSLVPNLTIPSGLDVKQLSRDKTVVEAYVNDPLVHDRISLSAAKSTLPAIDWAFNHAEDIHVPMLIMQGSMDKICFPNGTKDFVKKLSCDVTLKFWDGFYHEVHNDPEWEQVISYMVDWLNDHLN